MALVAIKVKIDGAYEDASMAHVKIDGAYVPAYGNVSIKANGAYFTAVVTPHDPVAFSSGFSRGFA